MGKSKTVHVISHSHWDREWYLPYEKHHVRLIQLMDTLLETLERDPEYRSFHLDGQTIMIDDYLQVRPDMADKLKKYIQEDRIHIGPWYILQDEFLTSSEANVRNLLTGLRDAEIYGRVSKVGYFPDSFGNMGQAPQMLKQAGIEYAVFGRGVKPTGFNNAVDEADHFESPYSELIWKSPDGSEVLGILFANWYNNGMHIPVDQEQATEYWDKKIASADKFASTPHLLMMNGCDHQPIQTDLSQGLDIARKLYPDIEFIHSNFDDYLAAVKKDMSKWLTVIQGELRSQRTHGWQTLVNTASSRVYMKQENQQCQTLLEKGAEPLSACAAGLGYKYPHHLLNYAWKTLMQNHPHDSICGCSVDEVHQEMMTRFAKSKHVAEQLIDNAVEYLGNQVNTASMNDLTSDSIPFVVYNTTGWERSGTIEVELDLNKQFLNVEKREEIIEQLKQLHVPKGKLVDSKGNFIPFKMEDLGVHFTYELPVDRFRIRYLVRRIRLTVGVNAVMANGYCTYVWSPEEGVDHTASSIIVGQCSMENEFVRVEISEDGSLNLLNKKTGRRFTDLCIYEDTGDIGNEYIYRQPLNDHAITTKGLKADIRLIESSDFRVTYEIVHHLIIPEASDEVHQQEMKEMLPPVFDFRKGGRSDNKTPLLIRSRVTLEQNARSVKVQTTINNQAKNHRIRVLCPTDIQTKKHAVDSIFEVAERNTIPAEQWQNPSNCQHQQAFVDVFNDTAGLTIANKGLHEYEVLRDGRNTIAVTLLRAVGEMGDWGVFPTPEAQCLGENTVEYEIIPHGGGQDRWQAYQQAYQFQVPWFISQSSIHEGPLPAEHSFIQWEGSKLALSAVKRNEKTDDLVIRWFNMSKEDQALKLQNNNYMEVYESNIIEVRKTKLVFEVNNEIVLKVGPAEIKTVCLVN